MSTTTQEVNTETMEMEVVDKEVATQPPAITTKLNDGNNARASWNVGGDSLAYNLRQYQPEQKQLFIECFRWCLSHNIHRRDFAAAIGVHENRVYKLMTGKYLSPTSGQALPISQEMMTSMRQWLAQQRGKAWKHENFVVTPTAERIFETAELARESGSIAYIIGESHLGKTMALEYHATTHNHGRTCYVRLGAASGIGGMLDIIGEAVGVPGKSNRRAMIDRISNALQDGDLILFDEFHELMLTYRRGSFFACAEIIREFYDRCQLANKRVGFVLSITKVKWDEITRLYMEDMKQLLRRGVHRCMIGTVDNSPLVGDVKAILAARGLPWPKRKDTITVHDVNGNPLTETPYELLRQLGKKDGLKAICERIRYAEHIAKRAGRDTVEWTDFIDAHLRIHQSIIQAPSWK